MEVLEFLNERKRMCNSYKLCNGCPLQKENCRLNNLTTDEECKKIISAVEQWPEARIGDDGVLQILPCSISASHRNARGNCATMERECPDCCREFWSQEVE